jgi:arylsulfatase A-like enzyme
MQTLLRFIPAVILLWSCIAAAAPNVVLIMADDLGYGDLSCYGSSKIRTPTIDKMASEGLRLTSYYSGNTVCTPSRMALLTGAYPPRCGWRGGVLGYGVKTVNGLAPEARTMAEVFKGAGYRTAICGKWHIGNTEEMHPLRQGFDFAYFIKMSNNQTKELWRDDTLAEKPFDNRRLSGQFTREAITFIRASASQPFFLYLPYTAPHFPAQAHPDWDGKSQLQAYGDVVEELDARVGEILAALEDTGVADNTILVFTSDNGPEPGQRQWATAAPHRGLKWSALEGGTRVPCILRWQGKLGAGVSDKLVGAIDLLPTLAAACDIPLPAASPTLDGLNLWPSLSQGAPHPRESLIHWHGWGVPQAIRVGDWKLYVDSIKEIKGSDQGSTLFNLSSDPAENQDVAAAHPERVAAMRTLLQKQLAEIAADAMTLGGPPLKSQPDKTPQWLKAN